MDSLVTPLPGKANDSKPKLKQKGNQPAKLGAGELKKSRVFGTVRSTNIEGKPVWDTTIAKPKTAIPHRQPKPKPKPIRATQLPIDHTTSITQASSTDKKSPENVKPRLNKKTSDTLIPQLEAEKNTTKNNSQENNDSAEPKTPAVTTTPPPKHVRGNKSKVTATPFYSAVNCSKCRFDKLETSSYWISQIKLAESVGKHFVSVACFKLAFECQAEPIRNLRIQLRRYLSRHDYLLEQKEWREVASSYGLQNLLPGTG